MLKVWENRFYANGNQEDQGWPYLYRQNKPPSQRLSQDTHTKMTLCNNKRVNSPEDRIIKYIHTLYLPAEYTQIYEVNTERNWREKTDNNAVQCRRFQYYFSNNG